MPAVQVALRGNVEAAVIILFNPTFILTKPRAKGIVINPVFFMDGNQVYNYGIKRR